MTDEERRRVAAERKAAYRKRKKEEALAELSKKSPKQPIPCTPTPEDEERWKQVQPAKIELLSEKEAAEYVSNKEKAEAVVSEAVAREEYVNYLFAKYAKTTNIPQLLQGIIREQIETRVVLIDLLANGVRK